MGCTTLLADIQAQWFDLLLLLLFLRSATIVISGILFDVMQPKGFKFDFSDPVHFRIQSLKQTNLFEMHDFLDLIQTYLFIAKQNKTRTTKV